MIIGYLDPGGFIEHRTGKSVPQIRSPPRACLQMSGTAAVFFSKTVVGPPRHGFRGLGFFGLRV